MGKKIYLLEDDEGIREVIGFILQAESYEVKSFDRISDFMQAEAHRADLFLLDVMLPDGDGLKVCQELKAGEGTKDIPVVMMSAHADMKAMANSCPAEDYIPKPFDINVLIAKIQHHIQKPGRA